MTLEELGRRAVACKHWRWMPGMYAEPLTFRVVWTDDHSIGESDQVSYFWERVPHIYPDLSDFATLGCLLALVREAWKANVSTTYWPEDGDKPAYWAVELDRWYEGETEGASLVAALEAAP